MRLQVKLLFAVAFLLILTSCSDFGNPVVAELPLIPQEVQSIFDQNCLACHGGSGNLYLAEAVAWENLVNEPANSYSAIRVVPSNPDSSVLWNKLIGSDLFGAQMPLGGALSTTDLNIIENWIQDGAATR